MSEPITDIWFRSSASLRSIAEQLQLSDVSYDLENYWEWVIGTLNGASLDITRTHTCPPADTDTRIFLLGNRFFPPALTRELVLRLRALTSGPIYVGQWHYLSGDEFEQQIVDVFDAEASL
jgi:hypothetical protein